MAKRGLVFLLMVLLCAGFAGSNYAAVKKSVPAKKTQIKKTPLHLFKDNTAIQVRHFDQDALNRFKKDPKFNYKDNEGAGELSFFEKLWRWIWETLFGWMRHAHADGTWLGFFLTLLKYLIYIGLFALVVFVVIKSIGIDPVSLFRRGAKKIAIPYSESIEDINAIDFDDELEKAIAQNNYRLAVRLLYLRSLKQLSDLQLIHWQIDKTNSTYVNELADPSQRQVFSLITRQFEYVWYGNFSIDKQAFVNISLLFQDFKQKLS